MSLEKQKRELEYEIERESDPQRLKLLKSSLRKVLLLIEELYVRGQWLMEQLLSRAPAKPLKSATALAILSILAVKNSRAAYALVHVENLADGELWRLISSIAQDEAHQGQAPFGMAIGSILEPKLGDWKKMQLQPPEALSNDASVGLRRKLKP